MSVQRVKHLVQVHVWGGISKRGATNIIIFTGIMNAERLGMIFVTGPEKTGLIYTKYTYSYYGAYLFFCVCYANSVSFIEFLRILCLYQEICVKMLCC